MSNPYREGAPLVSELDCPRCGTSLPPSDTAACTANCGMWVSADAAGVTLGPDERRENLVTRWWRVRAPCPICGKQMHLCGTENDALFQGCSEHGYWIDADTVGNTSLATPGAAARIKRMCDERDAHRAVLEQRERDEEQRARERDRAEQAALAEQKRRAEERDKQLLAEKRERTIARVNAALATGDSSLVVDEIMRLEAMIVALADRLTDVERALDDE